MTERVVVAELPALTEPLDGLRPTLKSATAFPEILTVTTEEDDDALAVSPPYAAVMACVPTLSDVLENVATPEARLAVPI